MNHLGIESLPNSKNLQDSSSLVSNEKLLEILHDQEARSLENSLTYLMLNKEFAKYSPREQVKLLTNKVMSIRFDYRKIEAFISGLK